MVEKSKQETKQDKRAAALRANLKKRKGAGKPAAKAVEQQKKDKQE